MDEVVPDGVADVALTGELDLASAPAVRKLVTKAVAAGATSIVFDAAELTFVDSSGLAALLVAVNSGLSVTVSRPTAAVRRAIEISGLAAVLPMTS